MTETIMRTLRSYVENGGSLFISLPHFSTRKDREFRNFTKDDLINGGDLTALCDIRVKGRRVVSGQFITERELDDREKIDFDLRGGVKDEPLADVTLGSDVEVVTTVGDRPLLVRQKIGKGEITVMLSWEYPGKACGDLQDGARLAGRQACRIRSHRRCEHAGQDAAVHFVRSLAGGDLPLEHGLCEKPYV